ncbi:hypothetical protein [Mesorhizobium sp. M1365]|uniref:ImmA/IrrE family metallo-endopeptidase n=1 Tax=Mesorhizobium sp. M1365 TaxID=2957090 RepID=UPI003334DF8C
MANCVTDTACVEMQRLLAWARSRALLLVLCLVALSWLIIDGSPTERRALAINAALQRGEIGGLTLSETAVLQQLLQDLVASAGVKLPVVLNEPFSGQAGAAKDQIRVFTTKPTARPMSGNGRGNASYDSMLDAIFVDLDIVRPAKAVQMYANIRIFDGNVGGSYGYLSFVFLHELGHRVLHRNSGTSLDTVFPAGGSVAKKYENEADLFALAALRAHFQTSRSIGRYAGPSNVDDEGFTGALAQMVDDSNRSLLFSSVPYSPFYSDEAHPTFLSRTLGFLAATSLAEREQANWLMLVQQGLLRISDVAKRPLLEIHVPDTISSVSSNKGGIVIVGKDRSNFLVDRSSVEAFDADASAAPIVAAAAAPRAEPASHPAEASDAYAAAMSQVGSDLYLRLVAPATSPPRDGTISARSPALFVEALLEAGIIAGQGLEPESKKLLNGLAAAGLPERTGFMLVGAGHGRMHALVFDLTSEPDHLIGVASIEANNLSALSIDRLDLEPLEHSLVGLKFHAVPTPAGIDYYAVGDRWQSQGPEVTGAEICVWKISSAPPETIVCHPEIAAAVPGWRNGNGWPYGEVLLMATVWLAPDRIVANVHGDSVYAFDLTRRRASVVFHPGGLNIVALSTQDVLFYATGAHKAFVVKP